MSFYNWDMLPLSHDRPGVAHRRIFGDNIQMQHLITEPGGTPSKLHNHPDHEEFFYIQAGEWEFTLEDEVRRIGPGDVVHVKAGAMHTLRLPERGAGDGARGLLPHVEPRACRKQGRFYDRRHQEPHGVRRRTRRYEPGPPARTWGVMSQEPPGRRRAAFSPGREFFPKADFPQHKKAPTKKQAAPVDAACLFFIFPSMFRCR